MNAIALEIATTSLSSSIPLSTSDFKASLTDSLIPLRISGYLAFKKSSKFSIMTCLSFHQR
nr:MAG TPA: hypothetical protein [Caudoviricetes sp.]